MRNIILILFVATIYSCAQTEAMKENEFRFNLKDNLVLKMQIERCIDSLKSENISSSAIFRNDSVIWWNVRLYIGETQGGKAKFITPDIGLNQIIGIDHLEVVSLFVIGDTIKGIINVERFYFPDDQLGYNGEIFCLDTNQVNLVIGKSGKISEIIYFQTLAWDCVWDCWEDESNNYSTEFRGWAEIDSIDLHKNDYRLIPAGNRDHPNSTPL